MSDVRLIDANALKKKMTVPALGGLMRFYVCGLIDEAPTIPAQPVKRGMWINKGGVHCSRCGWRPTGKVCDLFTDFCAGCGADMRGDADENHF